MSSTKRVRGRPKKPRNIIKRPFTSQFSPRGHVGRPGHVDLSLSDFEALRLADFEGASQRDAARSMGVSQQTFSRILVAARRRLMEGLVLGKIINFIPPKAHHKTR
ncbi:DUF134 domain-containing protein [Candidatus Omnitrophota bacterium]